MTPSRNKYFGPVKGETIAKPPEPPTPNFPSPSAEEEEKKEDIDLKVHIVPPTRYKFERDQSGQNPGEIRMNFSFPHLSKTTGKYYYESQFINIPKSVASQLKAFLIVSKTKVLEIEE